MILKGKAGKTVLFIEISVSLIMSCSRTVEETDLQGGKMIINDYKYMNTFICILLPLIYHFRSVLPEYPES